MSEQEKKAELKPILLTKNELRIIIFWRHNCNNTYCPAYSIEGGADYCSKVTTKLVELFQQWTDEEEGKVENA